MVSKYSTLTCLILFLCCSCNPDRFTVANPGAATGAVPGAVATPFTFPSLLALESINFDTGSNTIISSVVVDKQNNVYVLGSFIGGMDSVTTLNRDIFLVKLDTSGSILWKIHFNSSTTGVSDASLDETPSSMLWNESDDSIYFVGVTKSPLIEPNSTATNDLIIAKVSSSGNLTWLKHFGETTQNALRTSLANPSLNFTAIDNAGHVKMSPSGDLIFSFDTEGSIFEVSAGLSDVGVMKINKANGSILDGVQIGSVTLAAWGVSEGVAVSGNLRETLSSGNFDFDRTLMVFPFRTTGATVETNGTGTNDAGYFILNSDLTVNKIKQLGAQSYAAWVGAGNFSGSVNADNQFRSVVVNGPDDYLFYGKTSNDTTETRQSTDYLFARYVGNNLVSLIQYGMTTMPSGTGNQEPRFMQKDEDGNIYCSGHTTSPLFETLTGTLNPVIFRVNQDGVFQNGSQLGAVSSVSLGMTDLHYSVIQSSNFIIKDGKILIGTNNDPTTSGVTFNATLWGQDAP